MKIYPKKVHREAINHLSPVWGEAEASSIAQIILDFYFGISPLDIIINGELGINEASIKAYDQAVVRLLDNEPVQYVVGQADFYDRQFFVNQHTLIPRPETELLIRILTDAFEWDIPKIADIGTGTGCIAISLALEITNSQVTGFDVSKDALAIAEKNNHRLESKVDFIALDILKEKLPATNYDLIISNPPYVLESEKQDIKPHVLSFEPELALFVPDTDPLLFYVAIAHQSAAALNKNGVLFFEINERFGQATAQVINNAGFEEVKIYKDLHDKDRFVSGRWKG